MYIGIDIGTSSVKAVLIDARQHVLGSAAAALEVSRPHPGWSEQRPQDWCTATTAALDRLKSEHGKEMAAVTGIGLSGQMHGATLLDADDNALRPAILWNDGRSHAQARALDQGEPRFRSLGGNVVMPGFTAPKLAWVAKHEPEVFARIKKVLLPKDYVRLWLTGEYASDMSDAAGTLWMDVAGRRWSEALLAATGLTQAQMPRLVEGTDVTGRVRPEHVARWGFAGWPIVAGGGGDNAAAACGVGVVAAGDAFVSLGTSGVLFAANAGFSPNTEGAVHAFCHALPDTWHQMGVILSAAGSLEWLSGLLGRSPSDLLGGLGDKPTHAGRLLFLPYLSGERTPHNDARVRAAFTGLGHESDAASLTQGVLEGVAYAFADCRDVLQAAGTTVGRLLAVGGGSRSRGWLAILAAVLDRPIDVPADGDYGGAYGAARLGLIAAEKADPLAVCTRPTIAATVEPDATLATAYVERLAAWRRLYPALKELSTP